MLSALNFQLSTIESRIVQQTSLLAKLEVIALHKNSKPHSARRQPVAATSSNQHDEPTEDQHLENLQSWILKLRVQATRTLRRVDRLWVSAERRDLQLAEIKNLLVESFGGCASIRPLNRWTSAIANGVQCSWQPAGSPGKKKHRASSASDRDSSELSWRHSSAFQPAYRSTTTTPTQGCAVRELVSRSVQNITDGL